MPGRSCCSPPWACGRGASLRPAHVQAPSQGLLPATGTDVRVGDLRSAFGGVYDRTPAAEAPAWSFTPTLDVSESYDDGTPLRDGRTGTDFITQITPGIAITADSVRVTGSLYYAPSGNLYASHGSQNQIQQNLNGSATVTVVPDLLFIDLRGYASQSSLSGGQTQIGNTYVGSQNQVNNTSLSIAPYLQHRFGGTGTLVLGYSVARTTQDLTNATPAASSLLQASTGNVTTQQENISFTTGEDYGRFQDTASGVAVQYAGTGSLQGAYNDSFSNSVQYALSRLVTLTGSIGHEDIHYGGIVPFNINDITWSGGVRLTPDEDSSLAISYGRSDGTTSLTVDGALAPTARSRVFVRYSQGIGTSQQDLQNAVAASTVGAGGVSIDPATGAPLLLSNNALNQQPGIYRTSRLSADRIAALHARRVVGLGRTGRLQAAWRCGDGGQHHIQRLRQRQLGAHNIGRAQHQSLCAVFVPGFRRPWHVVRQSEQRHRQPVPELCYQPDAEPDASYTRVNTDNPVLGQPPDRDIAIIGLHKTF